LVGLNEPERLAGVLGRVSSSGLRSRDPILRG
jgi:hypothetical protein